MKTTLQIQNLKCRGCENTIITQLLKLEGISDISVNQTASPLAFKNKSEDHLLKVKKVLSTIGNPIVGDK